MPKTNVQLKVEAISIYVDDNSYPSESADLSFSGWNTNYLNIAVLPSSKDAPDPRSLYQAKNLCKALAMDSESKHKITIKIHPYMSGPGTDTKVVLAEGSFTFDGSKPEGAIWDRCRAIDELADKHPLLATPG